MHRAFHEERRLVELNMCPCEGCTQTSALKLKFVAHVGEVATQTIKRRQKLVGMDVIYVHRLLKNPVQVPEYVLVSEDYRHRRDGRPGCLRLLHSSQSEPRLAADTSGGFEQSDTMAATYPSGWLGVRVARRGERPVGPRERAARRS
jgi:hypothetical protein